MELNGYETKSPLGKTAKTVRIHAYLSAGMKEINRKIEDQFLQDFGGPKLSFRTFPFVVFQILNELSLNEEELFLIDIGGEISDLILVRKNSLEKIISFPYGRNFLLRKISSAFNTFPEEASSILGSYLKEHRHEEEAEKISKIIEETKKEWGDSFETAVKNLFESLPAGGPLPQNLYLLGDEAVASELVKSAGEERFSRFTVLGKPFNIKKISFEETDTFLMMESLFANKFL